MSRITLFAVPKAFEGHTAIIQANAINSWLQLSPDVEVLIIGNDPGVADFSRQHGIHHIPEVARNDRGTPLLNSVFQVAHEHCRTELMMYVNCDIILNTSLLRWIDLLDCLGGSEFLSIGMRWDFDQFEEICFDSGWENRVEMLAKKKGELASILCKDFFLFRSSQYRSIPPFSIGRGNWDSWMVSDAVRRKLPIIDATPHLFAGHQNHDYEHVGGRMTAYLSGEEARQNIRLAEGRHYVKGSLATHTIVSNRLKVINRFGWWTMVKDSPRLMKQLLSFVYSSKRADVKRKAA